jgi:hypothetical protein
VVTPASGYNPHTRNGGARPAPQAGLQEKATFLQVFGGKPVFSAFIRAPAWAAALLLPLGLLVLWPQVPQGPAAQRAAAAAARRDEGDVAADEEESLPLAR